jgi:hypothetical protein
LQLLTARCLNDYKLPDNWIACAAVNDLEDGYDVQELDTALLSRFVRIGIEPDQNEWCAWARKSGIDEAVIGFIEDNPNVFSDPQSNPRSWTYVSRLVKAAADGPYSPDDLTVSIAGLVGETWSAAFSEYMGGDKPLGAIKIVQAYAGHAGIIRRWKKKGRVDLQQATWSNVQRHLQRKATFDAVVADAAQKKNVETFLRDLVPDLASQAREWFEERRLSGLVFPKRRTA